jgi:hypothetical protein
MKFRVRYDTSDPRYVTRPHGSVCHNLEPPLLRWWRRFESAVRWVGGMGRVARGEVLG